MERPPDKVKEPFSAYGHYTYADYLSWQLDERIELIRGEVFKQAAAAPRRVHQEISMVLSNKLYEFLKGKTCKVYVALFDVRLPVSSRKHEDIDTVVQPDLCVVCDPEKLDELGCVGAPDLIVEILSPGNNKKEIQLKYEVYEASGAKEYWVVHPDERTLLIYTLETGKYRPSRLFTLGDRVSSQALPGFELDLDEVFGEL
ncbi:Endonuclease, Uma2 family (restriction endonuclease fold) [Cyclobacterium xiamenense]|uniref:Endonuclease, Uma2 family (Restriction endonuclease fold) n=1 Tax=Cyclobacterium xiamenense TaxID=1297121 RepID=A0A1H6WDF4_9BACT|nr:Uma2 family endonuclease [Cyclobacterium xiamenense]SEJ15051.1 Endonuclease, Uma2 family (restriction endonuclease fold) [Cyclobacterium xiamenense]